MVEYTAQAGDTLRGIAERFYGTGYEYPRLLADNVGRQMADGRRFTQAGVIHPGWVLLVHPASRAVEDVRGEVHYTVQEGDTLRGIAARLLNDESCWPEIFELNAGKARLQDGRVLKDPGLIWPGLRLQLPSLVPAGDGEVPVPEPAAATVNEDPVPTEVNTVVDAQPTATADSAEGEAVVDEPSAAPTPAVWPNQNRRPRAASSRRWSMAPPVWPASRLLEGQSRWRAVMCGAAWASCPYGRRRARPRATASPRRSSGGCSPSVLTAMRCSPSF